MEHLRSPVPLSSSTFPRGWQGDRRPVRAPSLLTLVLVSTSVQKVNLAQDPSQPGSRLHDLRSARVTPIEHVLSASTSEYQSPNLELRLVLGITSSFMGVSHRGVSDFRSDTIGILVAVVVVPSASFLSRVSVEVILQKIAVIRNTIGSRLEVIRCTSPG